MKSTSQYSRRAAIAALAGCLAVASVVAIATDASAWTPIGCKHSGSTIYVVKNSSLSTNFKNATDSGRAKWPTTGMDAKLSSAAPTNSSSPKVQVVQTTSTSMPLDTWAVTGGECASTGKWVANTSRFEWNARSGADVLTLTAAQKAWVGTHELGHAMGLGHVVQTQSPVCGPVAAVMRQGSVKWTCGWTLPSGDDKDGIDALY